MLKDSEQQEASEINVVLNWFEELEYRPGKVNKLVSCVAATLCQELNNFRMLP